MNDLYAAWRQLTCQANTSFAQGHFRQALRHFRRARDLSLERIDRWPNSHAAMTAIVISFLNIAEALAQMGRHAEAAENLCLIHQNLMLASLDEQQPECLRQAARERLPDTRSALNSFVERHGEHPLIVNMLVVDRYCDDNAAPHLGKYAMNSTLH